MHQKGMEEWLCINMLSIGDGLPPHGVTSPGQQSVVHVAKVIKVLPKKHGSRILRIPFRHGEGNMKCPSPHIATIKCDSAMEVNKNKKKSLTDLHLVELPPIANNNDPQETIEGVLHEGLY